jgi:hypothetical protein
LFSLALYFGDFSFVFFLMCACFLFGFPLQRFLFRDVFGDSAGGFLFIQRDNSCGDCAGVR